MKILFVRPPRHFWPFNSETSSFWQPLGFAYLAASLRENDFKDVKILDCPPLKIGWKSLAKKIEKEQPDILGIGEETSSSNEALRLARLSKKINPDIINIAGGHFFSFMAEHSLNNHSFDFIVKMEGEKTIVDLAKELSKPKRIQNFGDVKGIAFKKNNRIIETPPQSLVDMDSLPIPAYDLLPMDEYGKNSKNHPRLASIEHSRGCVDNCKFCSLWKTMGRQKLVNGKHKIFPCYRTRSVDRQLEEVEVLVKKYHKKTLGWVDSTWNADPGWNKEFCQRLIDDNLNVWQTAWMRGDFVVRDERLGTLKTQVNAGLVQSIMGAERTSAKDLKLLNKHLESDITRKACQILKEKYSSVYTIVSFIYGLPDEDKKSLRLLNRIVHSDYADMIFLLPYTPYPGTDLWYEAKDSGLLEEFDFGKYNLHLPIMRTNHLTRKQLDFWFRSVLFGYLFYPDTFFKRVFLEKNKRKKAVQLSLAKKIFKAGANQFWNRLTLKHNGFEANYGQKPEWYED